MTILHQIVQVLHLLPLAHLRNAASLSLSFVYYFGRCSSELDELVPLPPPRGRSTCCSNRLHDFSVTIPGCCKNFYVNSFFPHTPRLWNSLPAECFPLTYDLNGLIYLIIYLVMYLFIYLFMYLFIIYLFIYLFIYL